MNLLSLKCYTGETTRTVPVAIPSIFALRIETKPISNR
uniref:Uncharacterized protein n=1 Tax=Rhizophora mucronata TaxID=61149 RepID=A0A2P2PMG8_RHIMU